MAYFHFPSVAFVVLLIVCCAGLAFSNTESNNGGEKTPRIAIIGSGIGGSASAYFIREIFGENAQISVFEKADRVGGRLATVDIAGETFESGGSIIHPRNLYMKKFATELGLEMITAPTGIFSLYDGKNIIFSTSSNSWLTALKLLWRYGFSVIRMEQATKSLLEKFKSIYEIQDKGEAFKTVPDLLKAMDPDFYKITQISARKYLLKQGLSELLIDELVTAITRINYGQSTEVNAFAGMVALAGSEPNLWSVKGGNWRVCEGLLNKSKVVLNKNTQILEIIKKVDSNDEAKPLYYLRSVDSLISAAFDAVIVALPLEITQNFIGCSECSKWPSPSQLGQFQQTVVLFVNGTPSYGMFKCESDMIGTLEKPDIYFSSLGKQSSVYRDKLSQVDVWKTFSRNPLTLSQKVNLFSHESEYKELSWQAYPHYTPPEKFQPFLLDEGVFYVNPIEWVASAMEMSSLSAKNAALLTAKYLNKVIPISEKERRNHGEL